MKAIVYTRYGPPEVLQIKEVEKPVPKSNEVLIKVHAVTVTTYDCWCRAGTAPPGFWLMARIASGIRGPKRPILGTDMAGEIEAVGADVTRFKAGDPVIAFLGMNLGAYAEYLCLPEDAAMAPKPANLNYAESVSVVQGALTALYFLRKAAIQPGQHVLIYGASGGVGAYAVQLARYFGATVTGVCSTSKMALVQSLGADHVIDYTKEDFTQSDQTYDMVFDTFAKTSIGRTKRVLKKDGAYIFATFGLPTLLQLLWLSLTSKVRVVSGLLEETIEDMVFLKDLMESQQIMPVLDTCFPMEQAAEAHRYVESGRKKGVVAITITEGN